MLHILRPLRILQHGQRRWRVLSLLLLLLGSSPPAARRRRPILVVAAFQTTTTPAATTPAAGAGAVSGFGAGRRRYLYETTHRRLYEEDTHATDNDTGGDGARHNEDKERSIGSNPNKTTSNKNTSNKNTNVRSPTAHEWMTAMGTTPRRIVVSCVASTAIALTGNLFGLTSRILETIDADRVAQTGLDTYFPRGPYKRCKTSTYTFVVPKEWVADTFLELAKAQRQVRPLDYSMTRSSESPPSLLQLPQQRKTTVLPDAAYGPTNGALSSSQQGRGGRQAGDTNVSVIVSTGLSGLTLRGTLGPPREAAETLLANSIAPAGSGRTATLLEAVEVVKATNMREKKNSSTSSRSLPYYQFEYVVDRGPQRGPPLHNIAVIAASPAGDTLYTLTVVAPEATWNTSTEMATTLRTIATSFQLLS